MKQQQHALAWDPRKSSQGQPTFCKTEQRQWSFQALIQPWEILREWCTEQGGEGDVMLIFVKYGGQQLPATLRLICDVRKVAVNAGFSA